MFAKVNLYIKNANRKLILRTPEIAMESEMEKKHCEKIKSKKDIDFSQKQT